MHKWKCLVLPAAALLSATVALAQQQASSVAASHSAAYDLKREITVVGTVVSYTAASNSPFGARLSLQTGSGVIDVHLGDSRLLAANKFTVHSGDSLRIIGETVFLPSGTQFVARIVQNGNQAVAVRSSRGFPLSYIAPRNASASKSQGGVL